MDNPHAQPYYAPVPSMYVQGYYDPPAPPSAPRFFRVVQRGFEPGNRSWGVLRDLPDATACVGMGYMGVGLGFDTVDLTPDEREELWSLVQQSRTAVTKAGLLAREQELLSRCRRTRYLPPIDLDGDGTVEEKAAVANRISDMLEQELGIARGSYDWRHTGGKGLQLSLVVPWTWSHVDLLAIVRGGLVPLIQRWGIPCRIADGYHLKEGRPPIVVDEVLFHRDPTTRGVNWRDLGYVRPDGRMCVPFDFTDGYLPLDEYRGPAEIPAHVLDRWLQQYEAEKYQDVLYSTRQPTVDTHVPSYTPPQEATSQAPERPKPKRLEAGEILGQHAAAAGYLQGLIRWIKKWAPKAPHEMRLALSSVLLGLQFSPDAIVLALSAGTGNVEDARDAVNSTLLRLQTGQRVKGRSWIRRSYGATAVKELGQALAADAKQHAFDTVTHMVGFDLVRGNGAKFLEQLAAKHSDNPKLANRLRRPMICRIFEDRAYGADTGRLNGRKCMVCESVLCSGCFVGKLRTERDLLRTLWAPPAGEGKRTIYAVEVLEIPSEADLFELCGRAWLGRAQATKLRVIGYENGKPKLMILTDKQACQTEIVSWAKEWAHRKGLNLRNVTRRQTDDLEQAIEWAVMTKLSVHLHVRELFERERGDELLVWLDTFYGKHLVTSSPKGLRWPSKQDIRVASGDGEGSFTEYDGQQLVWKLTHTATSVVLHEQKKYPHSIAQAVDLLRHAHHFHDQVRQAAGVAAVPQVALAHGKVYPILD